MEYNIAKDFGKVAVEARRTANYLRQKPYLSSECNYEQVQSSSDVLEDVAQKIEKLLAKYYVFYDLFNIETMQFNDARLQNDVGRQIRTAIRQEIKRKHAPLRRSP